MNTSVTEQFNRIGTRVQFGSGALIFREGDICDRAHVLCSGRVKLSTGSREGRIMILRIARAGEVLGLSALLLGVQYELTAESIEPVRLRTVRRRTFLDFLANNPDASMRLACNVARSYKAAFGEVRRLALPATVSGRVASLLLDWSREDRPKGIECRHCVMPLTHEGIAAMTGTTRETVARVIGQFKREQIISIHGSYLTVLNRRALESLAA